ncbi:DUF418 domain-containing protein [Candidatus Albibeggiatoa sp. nov. NOAA]|uniref:DUF418 domain-containing protein n=1 Tax=Candidatus Albibeggiatoa sp. nov. NOAA TaxID=3162724 RepID=UPI0032F688CC|nr:DUF418 domain-containing protein [Thiotrichaceae bacterium]
MTQRVIGFDVARALAIFGMVIVNFKVVMSEEVGGNEWLMQFVYLFEGRASALFVVLAGVGVTLLTNKARQSTNPKMITQARLNLLKRSLLLIAIGVAYMPIWDADILHYYGFYFLIAVIIFTFSDQKLLITTILLTLAFPVLMLLFDYEQNWDWETFAYQNLWTVEGFTLHTLFNGVHPVFPWAAFLVFGMWLGRQNLASTSIRKQFLIYALLAWAGTELMFYGIYQFFSQTEEADLFLISPIPPMPQYLISATSSAVVIIMICLTMAERFKNSLTIKWLSQTGKLSLTLYVAHVLIGMGFLESIEMLEDQPIEVSLFSAVVFCMLGIVFSIVWLRYFATGPLEWIFRKLTH